MIPLKLKMRNFMPYRDDVPAFSFAGIHTACICGDNGNGKSALIDAITWALWGKSRAKSDDDLIHQGETDMEIEFDFAVEKQQYRIIRKRSKAKRLRASGQSSLDLQLLGNGASRPITGDTQQQTQQQIIDILHMDYDTFINSAYLRQGHADEFTQQPPARRKEVLASILGLGLYDRLEERAKDLYRQRQAEKMQLETTVADIDQALAQKPVFEAELGQAQEELARLEKAITEQQLRLAQKRQQKQSLENKRLQLAQLEDHIATTRRELERREEEISQHNLSIKEYEGLIARRPEIEEGYRQLAGARELNEQLGRKLKLQSKLKDSKNLLEQAIQKAQAGLVTAHAVANSKISELEAGAEKLPRLKKELGKLKGELHQLSQLEKDLGQARQQNQQLRTGLHELECTRERLEQEIRDIDEKLSLLQSQKDARCPLCETELGADGAGVIKAKYNAGRNSKTESLKSSQDEQSRRQIELDSSEKAAHQLEARLTRGRASLQGKTSLVTQQIAESEKSHIRLNESAKELAEIEKRLAGKDFAAREQEALGELEGELARLGYDPEQHEQVGQRLVALEKYEPPQRKLEEAERRLGPEKEAAAKASQAAKELDHRLKSDGQKKQALATELESLPQVESDLNQAEAGYQILAQQQNQAREATGSLKGKLEQLTKQELKKKELKSSLNRVAREEKIYSDLALAFGKKGIQAMLIEMVLPEIENEANRLLGRMTDNRMHVKIEAQRQSKKGELIETLDIKISDELGTRNYEMFSGGEAFRIDFAIRIALSRLLARRAGAPLPTLIIDEGFGTQDSTGVEKLKEAINSIQDDFQKIIVITHIEELKDAFPTRIEVIKTAAGATLEVS
jgi:exonuclease SbcC